eukprot:741493_1
MVRRRAKRCKSAVHLLAGASRFGSDHFDYCHTTLRSFDHRPYIHMDLRKYIRRNAKMASRNQSGIIKQRRLKEQYRRLSQNESVYMEEHAYRIFKSYRKHAMHALRIGHHLNNLILYKQRRIFIHTKNRISPMLLKSSYAKKRYYWNTWKYEKGLYAIDIQELHKWKAIQVKLANFHWKYLKHGVNDEILQHWASTIHLQLFKQWRKHDLTSMNKLYALHGRLEQKISSDTYGNVHTDNANWYTNHAKNLLNMNLNKHIGLNNISLATHDDNYYATYSHTTTDITIPSCCIEYNSTRGCRRPDDCRFKHIFVNALSFKQIDDPQTLAQLNANVAVESIYNDDLEAVSQASQDLSSHCGYGMNVSDFKEEEPPIDVVIHGFVDVSAGASFENIAPNESRSITGWLPVESGEDLPSSESIESIAKGDKDHGACSSNNDEPSNWDEWIARRVLLNKIEEQAIVMDEMEEKKEDLINKDSIDENSTNLIEIECTKHDISGAIGSPQTFEVQNSKPVGDNCDYANEWYSIFQGIDFGEQLKRPLAAEGVEKTRNVVSVLSQEHVSNVNLSLSIMSDVFVEEHVITAREEAIDRAPIESRTITGWLPIEYVDDEPPCDLDQSINDDDLDLQDIHQSNGGFFINEHVQNVENVPHCTIGNDQKEELVIAAEDAVIAVEENEATSIPIIVQNISSSDNDDHQEEEKAEVVSYRCIPKPPFIP